MAYDATKDIVMFRGGSFKVGETEYVVQVMKVGDFAAGSVVLQRGKGDKAHQTYLVKRMNQAVLEQALPLLVQCHEYMVKNPEVNKKPKKLEDEINDLKAQLAQAQALVASK